MSFQSLYKILYLFKHETKKMNTQSCLCIFPDPFCNLSTLFRSSFEQISESGSRKGKSYTLFCSEEQLPRQWLAVSAPTTAPPESLILLSVVFQAAFRALTRAIWLHSELFCIWQSHNRDTINGSLQQNMHHILNVVPLKLQMAYLWSSCFMVQKMRNTLEVWFKCGRASDLQKK